MPVNFRDGDLMFRPPRDDARQDYPQKITFGEMPAANVRGLPIYCSDFRCSHWTAISGDPRSRQ
jgi:hypothetical protein